MPKHVIEDAQVTLNGKVLSTRVKKVSIITGIRSPQLATAMGDSWEDRLKVSIRNFRAEFEFYQDYTSSTSAGTDVFNTLKDIAESTALGGVAMLVRPTTEIRSATNPEFSGNLLLDGDIPFIQVDDVGAVNMAPVRFLGAGALSIFTSSS